MTWCKTWSCVTYSLLCFMLKLGQVLRKTNLFQRLDKFRCMYGHPEWFHKVVCILLITWLAPRTGKMNQILRRDWLSERASHLARSGLPALSSKKNFPQSHIINPLLTRLVRSRWLDIGLVLFFCVFIDLDSISVHKHAKKELGQYPAILTSHLV